MRDRHKLISEFDKTAEFITLKGGFFTSILRDISNNFSFFMTHILQNAGCNRPIKKLSKNKDLIINIGCGAVLSQNMINIDLFPTLKLFLKNIFKKRATRYHLDLTRYDKNLSDTAKGVVLSHVIEHIPPVCIKSVFINCYKYLKQGGVLRVSFPYLLNYLSSPDGIPVDQDITDPMIAANKLIYGWFHRFMYNSQIIIALLEDAGFQQITSVGYGEGDLGDSDVPKRKKESVYITAYKL